MRTILLILVALALALLAIFTRGSVGSAVCVYSLIIMGSALLFKHFLVNRESDTWDTE